MDISATEPDADTSRRRVEDAISGHLKAVAPILIAQGLEARTALGLWHATMGSLLNGVGVQDAAKLIAVRSKLIRGHGQNVDVPSAEMSPETEVQVLAEVSAAANEFVEAIGGAYEDASDAGLDHLFGEVLVDVLAKTLIRLWGPFHARKAFGDQWLYFGSGRELVIHPAEPEEAPKPAYRQAPAPIAARNTEEPRQVSRGGRVAADRHADLRVEAEIEGTNAAFAVALETTERGGRKERRDIVGPSPEASVRKAVLTAAVEGIRAVLETEGKVSFRVTSAAAFLQAGMLPAERRRDNSRLFSEETLWASLDDFAALHRIEWRQAAESLSDDLAERCDRMLRRQLSTAKG